MIDRLTGLPVDRDLETILPELLGESGRCPAVFIDVDGFGGMNYELGHLVADEALRKLAKWLADAARALGGRAARIWGDEFVLLLPHRSTSEAAALAERLVRECPLLGLPYHHPMSPKRTFTISAVVFTADAGLGERATEVRESLENQLFEAKRALARDHEVLVQAG